MYRVMKQFLTRHEAAPGRVDTVDIWEHMTTTKYNRCKRHTWPVYKGDGNAKRSVDANDRLYMKCVDMNWKRRNRDSNAAINIFRLPNTNLEVK